MAQSRTVVVPGFTEELAGFEALVRSLSDSEWATPSRCEGWSVGDVCRHVTGIQADIAAGRLDDLVAPDASERQVKERAGRTQVEVADELRDAAALAMTLAAAFDDDAWAADPPVDVPGTLGEAVEGLWYDAWVHGDDIRAALGRPAERGPGLAAAVSHLSDLLTHRGWGPATLGLDGVPEFQVGGGGRRITGDPVDFVRAATGRADPAPIGLEPDVNVYA